VLHTVYRTTNLLDGRFYIGYHKTKTPDDSYLGSGLLLKRAVAKHGRENFRKEVLAIFDNARDAFVKERELLANCWGQSGCYNIHEGGCGGFEYINKNGLVPKMGCGNENPHFGKKQTERNRKAVAESNHRRVWQVTSKAKIKVANRDKKKGLSEAGRQKLRDRFLGKPAWNKDRTMPAGFGEKIAATKRGKARPPNVGLAVAAANKERLPVRWVNKDGAVLKIEVSKLDSFLAEGWKFGRK